MQVDAMPGQGCKSMRCWAKDASRCDAGFVLFVQVPNFEEWSFDRPLLNALIFKSNRALLAWCGGMPWMQCFVFSFHMLFY